MFYRRKILLALLQIFEGELPKIDLQKHLFLLSSSKPEPYFEFIPYRYGCFSFQANQDLSTLKKYGLVEESEKCWQLGDKKNYLDELKIGDKVSLAGHYQRYRHLKGNNLIKYVYEKYPYLAINSIIAESLLDNDDYQAVINSKPRKNNYALYTIGYEGKTVEYFTNQLIQEDIRILCDIRKNAFSMKFGFSKKQLQMIIWNVGIKYVHLPELGIDSDKRQKLSSKKDYEKLFEDYEKNILPANYSALEKLYKIFLFNKRAALMCFESDYTCCHRSRTLNALLKLNKKDIITKNI